MLTVILQFLSGIALFIFAMSMTEDSLKALAGRQFKKFLQNNINTPLKSISGGTIVTAILQSSSVVSLMTLSFVGAGLITMRNALAVTFGANLGTTLDSWIVAGMGFSFKLYNLAFVLLIAAVALLIGFKNLKPIKSLSYFILGFAFLFIGLEWMKESAGSILSNTDISQWSEVSPYWYILIGFVITTIVQSSSTTTALTLTAIYHEAIPFQCAIAVLIGSEVGTTIKIFIGAFGGIPDKKRVALGNLMYNLLLMLISSIFLIPISNFIELTIANQNPLIGLVTFQTGINLLTIALLFPFMGQLSLFLENRFTKDETQTTTRYIHHGFHPFSEDSIQAVKKEIERFFIQTIEFNSNIIGIVENESLTWIGRLMDKSKIDQNYQDLKLLQGEILEYLVDMRDLESHEDANEAISSLIGATRSIMHSAKKIKDIRHNIEELENTSNDSLFTVLDQVRNSDKAFYSNLLNLKDLNDPMERKQLALKLKDENDKRYNVSINDTLNALNDEHIRELDSSTLLNIHRAIHASHLSLIDAVEEFKLNTVKTLI